jgi:hypothetical protein
VQQKKIRPLIQFIEANHEEKRLFEDSFRIAGHGATVLLAASVRVAASDRARVLLPFGKTRNLRSFLVSSSQDDGKIDVQ